MAGRFSPKTLRQFYRAIDGIMGALRKASIPGFQNATLAQRCRNSLIPLLLSYIASKSIPDGGIHHHVPGHPLEFAAGHAKKPSKPSFLSSLADGTPVGYIISKFMEEKRIMVGHLPSCYPNRLIVLASFIDVIFTFWSSEFLASIKIGADLFPTLMGIYKNIFGPHKTVPVKVGTDIMRLLIGAGNKYAQMRVDSTFRALRLIPNFLDQFFLGSTPCGCSICQLTESTANLTILDPVPTSVPRTVPIPTPTISKISEVPMESSHRSRKHKSTRHKSRRHKSMRRERSASRTDTSFRRRRPRSPRSPVDYQTYRRKRH